MREVLAFELADDRAVAAFTDVEDGIVGHVFHEPDASRTQDAPIRDVQDVAAEILDRIEPLGLLIPGVLAAFGEGIVLQFALARLIANRAVERVVDEQHLEHPLARLAGDIGMHVHHLSVGDRRRTGRRKLRRLLHFHETHPTHPRHRQPRVVAIMGDEDARDLRGFEHRCAFGDLHLAAFDGQRHHLAVGHRIARARWQGSGCIVRSRITRPPPRPSTPAGTDTDAA